MEPPEETSFTRFASVVADLAIDRPLDYGIPPSMVDQAKKGMKVMIPLRGKSRSGFIVDIKEKKEREGVLPLLELCNEFIISPDLLELAFWMAEYYMTPLYQILATMMPSSVRKNLRKEQYTVTLLLTREAGRKQLESLYATMLPQAKVLEVLLKTKKNILLTELQEKAQVSRSPIDSLEKKGILAIEKLRLFRSPLEKEEYFPTPQKILNGEQKKALDAIQVSLGTFVTYLLHGVTGSGKTEIYMQAIESTLKRNQGAIMLVPEISLTVQTIERFRSRFEDNIAILHHRLSDGERCDEWERILQGEAKIVIGARSALFCPIQNLGLLIVDEEHDHAYKQSERMPCYNARDVAVMRGKMSSSVVVLGSATPSLESYYNAKKGKYTLLSLSQRAGAAVTPQITLVDMKEEYSKGYTHFSERLIEGIKKRIPLGEQTILFLNRRGYHTSFSCQKCGFIFKCLHCDTALTFHYNDNVLACHLCDYRIFPPPRNCSSCGHSEMLKYKGVGTELIERSLHALFPGIRTLRIDSDTTRHKGSYENLYRQFRTGKSDVLIGTQMIAKGLHFPQVTLVSILNSDGPLHIPDFRSSESAFQLITQVAGRAGRGELLGEVIIQTKMPEHEMLQLALKQDFEAFFDKEIATRNTFLFPPFTKIIKFLFEGSDAREIENLAQRFRAALKEKILKSSVLHPVLPSGYPKINDIYRFQFLLRGHLPKNEVITSIKKQFFPLKDARLTIDVDPISTFF